MEELEPEDELTLPPDLPFDEWVKHIFDHPTGGKQAWHWAPDAPWWDEVTEPARTLEYLVRLFETSGRLPETYSFDQIGIGFNYLVSASCSEYMFVFREESLEVSARAAGIRAMELVYRDLFDPHLGAGGKAESGSPLGDICFMWWDTIPLYCGQLDPKIDEAILGMLEATLRLKSFDCRKAALHGLGHNCRRGTENRVRQIIDEFLSRNSALPPDLVEYAHAARRGRVQ